VCEQDHAILVSNFSAVANSKSKPFTIAILILAFVACIWTNGLPHATEFGKPKVEVEAAGIAYVLPQWSSLRARHSNAVTLWYTELELAIPPQAIAKASSRIQELSEAKSHSLRDAEV
jgi:hypothetical protein